MEFVKLVNRAAMRLAGLAMVVAVLASAASATPPLPPAAPELDPGSIGSTLTLLMGGAMLLSGKRRKV